MEQVSARPIGLIGTGHMGLPMTRRLLQAGFSVVAFDVAPAALQAAVAAGATGAATPAEVGQRCQTVILMLPNSTVVEAVVREQGLAAAMAPGGVVIDMSSSAPQRTVELARWLARQGLAMLDAPVSGGVSGAERGALTIMVGGERALAERYQPLFQALGTTIHYVGGHGAGHTIKALNNLVSATTLAVTAEAVALAIKAGLELETVLAVLNSGTGRSWSSEYKFPTFIATGAHNSGFSLGLMRKDIDIALDVARDRDAPLFVAGATQQLYRHAVGQGHGDDCHTVIARLIADLIGVRLVEEPARAD